MSDLEPGPAKLRRITPSSAIEAEVRALVALLRVPVSFLMVLFVPSHVAAADDQATVFFKQGLALFTQQKYADAADKFNESKQLIARSSTSFALADCYANLHERAKARAEYLTAAALAESESKIDPLDASKDDEQRAADAIRLAEQLKPQITFHLDRAPPEVVLRINGATMNPNGLQTAIRVEPGTLRVDVTAPGFEPISREITVDPEVETQAIELPELQPASLPKPPPPPPPPPPPDIHPYRTLGWIVGGAGAASVAVGAVFGGLALWSTYPAAKHACGSMDNCNTNAMSLRSQAETQATVANYCVGIGAGVVAAGVVLYFVAKPGSHTETVLRSIQPELGQRRASLTVSQSF